ncbi:MAG: transcription elongation factor subunit Spt4 [Candidatus Aenigmarchaeota archaeon]|nr:transcription elongation factor subunit Spt4 [Candidatus Aenigmarchaeota archaeon]MDI6722630.1 transcription elongation factor subunit Spt4 [Candidatus Aenigmarchaeota archaeon]
MGKKACKSCNRIVMKGNVCPVCKTPDLTSSFQGVVVIFDTDSEIAKRLGVTAPGKYALKV